MTRKKRYLFSYLLLALALATSFLIPKAEDADNS